MTALFSQRLLRRLAPHSRPFLFGHLASYHGVGNRQPVLAIKREDVSWECRAPLNPKYVKALVQQGVKVLVEPSPQRAYTMPEYEAAGASSGNIEDADVIIGVKPVSVASLIADKTYAFFSHTIKAQPENMQMLDTILEKKICLVDYEKIENADDKRLVAFGKYAGKAGMINILHGMGMRLLALGFYTPFMNVSIAHSYQSVGTAKDTIGRVGKMIEDGLMPEDLGPLVFTFTGSGNVSKGAQEIMEVLPHEYVSPTDLPEVVKTTDTRKIYATVVSRKDYLERKDGHPYNKKDYEENPQDYQSTFTEKIAPYTSCLINGVYWESKFSRLITIEECREFKLKSYPRGSKAPLRLLAVCDISADTHGSIEFTKECTSFEAPFDVYDPSMGETRKKCFSGDGILMTSIDNLPAQLPRDATDFFSCQLSKWIMDIMRIDGKLPPEQQQNVSESVKKAVITYNGSYSPRFEYIDELRKLRA